MNTLHSLKELIFPSRCIVCNALGEPLCSQCRWGWSPRIYRSTLSGDLPLHVTSSVLYSEIAMKIILAAKESQIKQADSFVAEAIAYSVQSVLRDSWVDVLIPIPSRKSAARLRGRQFIEVISEIVGRECGIAVAAPLTHIRSLRDQSGLDFEGRRNNLEGAFVLRDKSGGLGRALLVDDLLTSGATLKEGARALRYAGIEVVGAVTAALAQTVR